MRKPGIYIILTFLVLVVGSSCSKQDENRNIPDSAGSFLPTDFETTLNDSIFDAESYDSLVYQKYVKIKPGLNNLEQLVLIRKMGEFFYENEIADSALIYFKYGLAASRKVENLYYTAVFHLMIGSAYTFVSEFEPALIELKSAYSISNEIDSLRLRIKTSRNLGNVYWSMGNYDLALEYYLISLEISQKAENSLGIASSLSNIGNVYQEVRNYDKAIEYYKLAEKIAAENNFSRIIAITNNNLGDVFSIKGNFDSALYYFNIALTELKKDSSMYDAGIYIGNIAELYLKTDSLEKAERYFRESLKYALETGDKTGIASCNLGLADMYLHKNDLNNSLIHLKKGNKLSEEIGSLKLMEYSNRLYAQHFYKENDFKNSFFYLKKQMAIKDSIYSQENGENVARLENQYKEIQSLKEIELLKEKQKNFLNLAILGFSAFIIISLLIFAAFRQKTRSNQLLREKNLQIEASKVILEDRNQQLIKSKEQLSRINQGKDDFLTIISHDLKNPLSSIRGFTELLIRSYDTLSDIQRKTFLNEVFNSIERISLLINNILYWVKSQTDGLQYRPVSFNLQKRINDNIAIYLLMLAQKEIHVENKVSEEIIVNADINVFDMIIRNLMSNALKFTQEKGSIIVDSHRVNGKVKISVQDTGIGIAPDKIKLILGRKTQYTTIGTQHEQGTGLGLGLTIQFIEMAGGKFEINSKPGEGTTILFTLDAAK